MVYEGKKSEPESPKLFVKGVQQHPALREGRGSQILSTETALQIQDGFPKSLLELILKELGLEMF